MNLELFNKLMELPPLQTKDEWRIFLEICDFYLKERKIKNPIVVELGKWKGKQRPFYEQLFGATYIGIDSSGKQCKPEIYGNSHDPETLKRLKEKLAGRPINILFIDGDHHYKDVKKDFDMYAPLCDDIVAFHDVNYPTVMRLWNELKAIPSVSPTKEKEYLSSRWFNVNIKERGFTDKDNVFILIEIASGIGMMIKNRCDYINLDNYLPKLNLHTVEFLKKIITPESLVLETGSGHSTIWFGKQVKRVVALEDNVKWYELIQELARKENLQNVKLYFDPEYSRKQFKDVMEDKDIIEYDIVLHDGPFSAGLRISAMKFIHLFVKAGGYLIVDDTHDLRCAMGIAEHLDILGWKKRIIPRSRDAFGHRKGTTIYQRPI